MVLPKAFFAEPRIRRSSPALAQLAAATALTPETPGIELAYAMHYYRIEMFATEDDRDRACGPSGNEDVRFFPTTRRALMRAGISIHDVSCGYTVDHPRFAEILTPIFDAAIKGLIERAVRSTAKSGVIADTTMAIARTKYAISVKSIGDWLSFEIEARSAFEEPPDDLIERTAKHLEGKLTLCLSHPIVNAKCN